jgi:hypothetical protein
MVAVAGDGSDSAQVEQFISWNKTTTLVLGTPLDIFPLAGTLCDDFEIVNDSENLIVRVTGNGLDSNWICKTSVLLITATPIV